MDEPLDFKSAALHEKFFRQYFQPNIESWSDWLILGQAIFGLPMTEDEFAVFQKYTGRSRPPEKEASTVVIAAGRRSGKSFFSSILACYLGLFYDYSEFLASGELAVVQVIANDKAQAAQVFRYISGILNENPIFQKMIVNETKVSIELETKVLIEVQTCSYRSLRGRTIVCCIADEIAFWHDAGSVNPSGEVIRAVKPALATIPNSKLIMISSPFSQRGVFFEYWKKYWQQDNDDCLVVKGESLWLNKQLSRELIEQDLRNDPEAARAEWGLGWRTDLSEWLDPALVDELIIENRRELPPISGKNYVAWTDSAGGAGKDSFSLAIAHRSEDGTLVLDCLRYKDPKFDPFLVVEEYAQVLKEYWVDRIHSDRWARGWLESAFREHGIRCVMSDLTTSEVYLSCEPLFSRKQIELLDVERLEVELKNLQRSTRKVGRDLISHMPGAHDDCATAATGALYLASQIEDRVIVFDPFEGGDRVISEEY